MVQLLLISSSRAASTAAAASATGVSAVNPGTHFPSAMLTTPGHVQRRHQEIGARGEHGGQRLHREEREIGDRDDPSPRTAIGLAKGVELFQIGIGKPDLRRQHALGGGGSLRNWLVVVTMLNAAISAGYYLRIVAAMFLRQGG